MKINNHIEFIRFQKRIYSDFHSCSEIDFVIAVAHDNDR